MRRRADIIGFGVAFLALSAVLGLALWSADPSIGSYRFATNELAVPVVSAMLASVGFTRRRKLTYAALTLATYILSGVAAELVGLHDLVREELPGNGSFPSVLTVFYMIWLTAFPVVMLVLFVGRRPSLLWHRQPN